ncbi:MAG: zinc ribbon domain-containing protein [Aridibacter sp.]
MYCPRCGQEQQNKSIRFCSRCGFLMMGMNDVVAEGGLPKVITEKYDPNTISPRKRGIKQGALVFFSGFIVVPFAVMISIMLRVEPFGVVAAAVLTFLTGFLWMLYSFLFQSSVPTISSQSIAETIKNDLTGKQDNQIILPPKQTETVSDVFEWSAGNWRETTDLQPSSVTEHTTKTLNEKSLP